MKHIISLGAGVQSSTMALMAAAGEITPMPDCAIFADTGDEPSSVYRWLDWLEAQLPFRVHRVNNGQLSVESTWIRESKKTGLEYLSHAIPAYILNEDGTKGTYFRQCTDKHKLTPINRDVKLIRGTGPATVWIGISADETMRVKDSQRKHVTHRWPLIEINYKREDCLAWMESHNYPRPPRSACSFCPYHSNAEWSRLRREEPEAFNTAVKYERALQRAAKQIPRLTGVPFLHPQRKPLDTIDFRSEEDKGQGNMWINECEGMCGV